MNQSFEKQYHELEQNHFWFKGRRDMIAKIIDLYSIPRHAEVLDIGCSSGILMRDLNQLGFQSENLYGIDVSERAIQNCKANGFQNAFVMDAQDITLDKKFDFIIASDCLEHLENDRQALHSWSSLLKENGFLVVFVPAYMFLWSQHDVANHHFRRYTREELVAKMRAANLRPKRTGYWNFLLFFPTLAVRGAGRLLKRNESASASDLKKVRFNKLLLYILYLENTFLKRGAFPFGVSTYCIAVKNT